MPQNFSNPGAFTQSAFGYRNRIALDYNNAGVGHPSKLNLWFSVVDGTSPGQQPAIDADTANADVLARLAGVTEAMAEDMADNYGKYASVDALAKEYFIAPYNIEQLKRIMYFSSSGATHPEYPPVWSPETPERPEDPPSPPGEEKPHLNLHTMSLKELIDVNGIGEATARKIIKYREDNLILDRESLLAAGISNSTINRFIDYICF